MKTPEIKRFRTAVAARQAAGVGSLLQEANLKQYAATFSQRGYSFVSDLLQADDGEHDLACAVPVARTVWIWAALTASMSP
jgi:hypothetical protein